MCVCFGGEGVQGFMGGKGLGLVRGLGFFKGPRIMQQVLGGESQQQVQELLGLELLLLGFSLLQWCMAQASVGWGSSSQCTPLCVATQFHTHTRRHTDTQKRACEFSMHACSTVPPCCCCCCCPPLPLPALLLRRCCSTLP